MATQIAATAQNQSTGNVYSRLIWVTPLVMIVTTIANLGLYAAAGALYPEVTTWPGAGPVEIVGASIVYLLIGAIVYAAVQRWSARPIRTYVIMATIGLIFSLWMPISVGLGFGPPGTMVASPATSITLSLMHILSYAITVPMTIRLTS